MSGEIPSGQSSSSVSDNRCVSDCIPAKSSRICMIMDEVNETIVFNTQRTMRSVWDPVILVTGSANTCCVES